jgi:exonuclease SbcC
MIKIKKISLQNFKGIKPLTVFSFDDNDTKLNILSGPNGFGKTTIFDVIEICLTNKFQRTDLFHHVQKKTLGRNKPFFQNTEGEDVIVKLWIKNFANNTEYIIIKHYDVDESPTSVNYTKAFIPDDSPNILFTYLYTDPTAFTATDFSEEHLVDPDKINEIFFGDNSQVNLSSSYYLFNYIQQEDSIYFLRQSEDDKGKHLSFLFNIEKEEEEKQSLGALKNHFLTQQNLISQQITDLRASMPNAQAVIYEKLFDSAFEFDLENPFAQLNDANQKISFFEGTLNTLITFRNEFGIVDFEKSTKYKRLNEQILNNDAILNALIMRDVYTSDLAKNLEARNKKLTEATEFLAKQPGTPIEKKYFDSFLPDQHEIDSYGIIIDQLTKLDKDLGAVGQIISELNEFRDDVQREFQKLRENYHEHIPGENCPLCDSPFKSSGDLTAAISKKGKALNAFNETKLIERAAIVEQIKEVYGKIAANVRKFQNENKPIDNAVITIIRTISNAENQPRVVLNEFPALQGTVGIGLTLKNYPTTIGEIEDARSKLKNYISQNLLPQFNYEESKIANKELYLEYFASSATTFDKITVEKLNTKILYLKAKYAELANDRLQFLQTRLEKVTNVVEKINSIYEKMHRTIQAHKKEMIEKIKIPFYIYSGKILQSYQQGLGIFIDIRPTGLNNNVQFKTGHSSDHDIVHHLSSGQKAVVSLAFCLSLNKVYATNQHFRFLAIDDPIQTMDDLNVHTFIELVRNEFSDYQIVMSTHDDFTSRYMKYKFDKFDMKTRIQNVQKTVIEQSNN